MVKRKQPDEAFLVCYSSWLIPYYSLCYGCAGGMEYKDKAWGGKWDWLDFAATCLGGLVGQVLQIILYFVIF